MLIPFEPRRLVTALDLGEPIDDVLETAVSIAKRYDAELHLVHVWSPWVAMGIDGAMVPASGDVDLLAKSLEEQLTRAAATARREHVDRVETALLPGTPWEQIVIYAEQHEADLIVSGTHGRTGLERLLVGSVAERVVRESTVPVLVVPQSMASAALRASSDAATSATPSSVTTDRGSDLRPALSPRRMP